MVGPNAKIRPTFEEYESAPDPVIEVLSSSSADRDRSFKRSLHARRGVGECWIVDPQARTVKVLTLGDRGLEHVATYRDCDVPTSPMLQGLRLACGRSYRWSNSDCM